VHADLDRIGEICGQSGWRSIRSDHNELQRCPVASVNHQGSLPACCYDTPVETRAVESDDEQTMNDWLQIDGLLGFLAGHGNQT
jgi:hypothetical protein